MIGRRSLELNLCDVTFHRDVGDVERFTAVGCPLSRVIRIEALTFGDLVALFLAQRRQQLS
ncbi:hypothetical protein A5784_02760 [Mycobacterium sp. 852013-50091_SCH5140682]|nr:hypothetical protein A5784_02760 [Mycobacterium sp. 852013-50091_SCH5140682]